MSSKLSGENFGIFGCSFIIAQIKIIKITSVETDLHLNGPCISFVWDFFGI